MNGRGFVLDRPVIGWLLQSKRASFIATIIVIAAVATSAANLELRRLACSLSSGVGLSIRLA